MQLCEQSIKNQASCKEGKLSATELWIQESLASNMKEQETEVSGSTENISGF